MDQATFLLYPNAAATELTVNLVSEYTGRIQLTVYDALGSQVLRTAYDKETDRWRVRLDIADLPAGLYRLQVTEGRDRTVQTFLRH